MPATPGGRQAALRHAADRVETALAGLERPLSQYLLELEPERAEGRSWYAGPGAGELVEWRPSSIARAFAPARTALPPSTSSSRCSCARSKASRLQRASMRCPTARRSGPGLFDLQDTLLGSTVDDLRALAA